MENLLFDGNILAVSAAGSAALWACAFAIGAFLGQHGEVVKDDLGGDGLYRSGFSRNQDGLIGRRGVCVLLGIASILVLEFHHVGRIQSVQHLPIGVIGGLVHVGRKPPLVLFGAGPTNSLSRSRVGFFGGVLIVGRKILSLDSVFLHGLALVQRRHRFEGIHGNQNRSGRCVDHIAVVSHSQGVKDCRFVKMRQPDQIVDPSDGRVPSGRRTRTMALWTHHGTGSAAAAAAPSRHLVEEARG